MFGTGLPNSSLMKPEIVYAHAVAVVKVARKKAKARTNGLTVSSSRNNLWEVVLVLMISPPGMLLQGYKNENQSLILFQGTHGLADDRPLGPGVIGDLHGVTERIRSGQKVARLDRPV